MERGDRVIAACRSVSNGLTSLDVQVEEGVDVSSEESVAHLVRRLGGQPIDWLINNAGVLKGDSEQHGLWCRSSAVRGQCDGASAHHSRALAPARARLKVGIVSSRMGSLEDNTSGSRYGYRMSKAAVNMAGVSLAHDLKDRGVAVALLHPGYVQTDMTGGRGNVQSLQCRSRLDRADGRVVDGQHWSVLARERRAPAVVARGSLTGLCFAAVLP